jgi:hypothetical protein
LRFRYGDCFVIAAALGFVEPVGFPGVPLLAYLQVFVTLSKNQPVWY